MSQARIAGKKPLNKSGSSRLELFVADDDEAEPVLLVVLFVLPLVTARWPQNLRKRSYTV